MSETTSPQNQTVSNSELARVHEVPGKLRVTVHSFYEIQETTTNKLREAATTLAFHASKDVTNMYLRDFSTATREMIIDLKDENVDIRGVLLDAMALISTIVHALRMISSAINSGNEKETLQLLRERTEKCFDKVDQLFSSKEMKCRQLLKRVWNLETMTDADHSAASKVEEMIKIQTETKKEEENKKELLIKIKEVNKKETLDQLLQDFEKIKENINNVIVGLEKQH